MFDSIGLRWISASRARAGLVAVVLTANLNGCAAIEQAEPSLSSQFGARPVTALPGWSTETAAGLRQALRAQCEKLMQSRNWQALCADPALETKPAGASVTDNDAALKEWVSLRFSAWPIVSQTGSSSGLLTGYFEPVITGSRDRQHSMQVPLYRKPQDLGIDSPYKTRAEIDDPTASPLAGLELVWLDDPVEAFFLHIQGSGRIELRDGQVMRVGFAAHNGHPYHAIGRDLIDRGAIARADMSAQAIKQWLRDNPDQQADVMQANPRYIFFRELPDLGAELGPPGSMQVPLTKLRSVATDKQFLPAGSLLYLDSQLPTPDPASDGRRRVGLALSQDTGAAITGQVRADLFTGSGQAAGALAGRMREPLRMWLLWPKHSAPPRGVVKRAVVNP